MSDSRKKTIVCLCHDVTVADLHCLYAQGFTHPETLKRASAVMMGPCQGKYCAAAVMGIIADLTGRPLAELRRPTARPPVMPVPIGLLADRDDPEEAE